MDGISPGRRAPALGGRAAEARRAGPAASAPQPRPPAGGHGSPNLGAAGLGKSAAPDTAGRRPSRAARPSGRTGSGQAASAPGLTRRKPRVSFLLLNGNQPLPPSRGRPPRPLATPRRSGQQRRPAWARRHRLPQRDQAAGPPLPPQRCRLRAGSRPSQTGPGAGPAHRAARRRSGARPGG